MAALPPGPRFEEEGQEEEEEEEPEGEEEKSASLAACSSIHLIILFLPFILSRSRRGVTRWTRLRRLVTQIVH